MQSAELASLAGVTVRTLRHYHQIGILPEPERAANGYRRYGVHDLIRVLRIRRLVAVGVPLEETPRLLDEPVAGGSLEANALLDRLEAELMSQEVRIAAQRAVIRRLRGESGALDIPPELGRFLRAMSGIAPSREVERIDRDQTVLLAHLVGESGLPQLVGFLERLSAPEVLPTLTDVASRFYHLDQHTSEPQLDGFVEDFVTSLDPVLRSLAEEDFALDLTNATSLLAEYSETTLTPMQQHALARIGERLDTPSQI